MKELQHQFPEYSAVIDGNTMQFYYNNMLEAVEQIGSPELAEEYLEEWAAVDGLSPEEAINRIDNA